MATPSSSTAVSSPSPSLEGEASTYDPHAAPIISSPQINKRKGFPDLLNALFCSFAFFWIFAAFNTVQNSLSNSVVPLLTGNLSAGTLYVSFCICCGFAPAIVNRLGPRLSMFLSSITYSLFLASDVIGSYFSEQNQESVAYIMIPFGLLCGIGASILWTAQGVYITDCAIAYSRHTGQSSEAALGLFNGIFFMVFQANGFVGECVYGILNSTDVKPLYSSIAFLVVCCVGCGLLLLLRASSPATKDSEESLLSNNHHRQDNNNSSGSNNLISDSSINNDKGKKLVGPLATLALWLRDHRMKSLSIIMFYQGLALGFIFSNLTKYVKDSEGASFVGWMMACFYLADMIGSLFFGWLSGKTGRDAVVIIGFILHVLFIGLFFCSNGFSLNMGIMAFILAIFAGFGDSVFNTQLSSIVGSCWPKETEAAFGNFKMWQSLGTAVVFFLNLESNMTMNILYIVSFFICVSIVSYCIQIVVYNKNDMTVRELGNNQSSTDKDQPPPYVP